MRVVCDTNVLVSALLNPYGSPAAVISLVLDQKITPCYDARILTEYHDVLSRPRFSFSKDTVQTVIGFIRETGRSCVAGAQKIASVHAADLPFAQVSMSVGADFLITGNTRHFPEKIAQTAVVTPASFISHFYT